jgi:hypothetical protein
MKVRQILRNATFDAEDLQRLQTVFEKAWLIREPRVTDDREKARERLAIIIVNLDRHLEIDEMKSTALKVFRFKQ